MRRLPFVARLLLVPCLALVNMPSSSAQILNGGGYSTITLGTTPLPSGATVTSLAGLTSLGIAGTPAATPTTDQTQASGGSALLPLPVSTGVAVGQVVSGTDIPAGDQVASLVATAAVTEAANGSFLTGQKVIPMSVTTGFAVGQQCTDLTLSTVIGAGNVIASIQAGTSITLTSNTGHASSGATDSIYCEPVATLVVATTAAVPVSTVVTFRPNASALSASSALVDLADASIYGNLNIGGILRVTSGAASNLTSPLLALFSSTTVQQPFIGISGSDRSGGIEAAVNGISVINSATVGQAYPNGTVNLAEIALQSASSISYLTSSNNATLHLGLADAAAPAAQTLGVQGVVAGTSNTAGANWTIAGSQGTGTGAGGSIIFKTAPAGSTGSAQNALAAALTIDSAAGITFGASALANCSALKTVSGVLQCGP
jgi:hypothetical protein